MPTYEYVCWNCSRSKENRADFFILEVKHRMSEEPKFDCPICRGDQIERIISVPSAVYVKGNGYLDKKGAHRDMNRYKLRHDDPYAHMREPGEAEELDRKLKDQGKINQGRTKIRAEIVQDSGNVSGQWDEKQRAVIWKQKEETKTDRPDIPPWLPNIE